MIPEHERLQACLSDVGRGRGENKPMPPKQGALWEAFVHWFRTAELGRAQRRADLWRAFSAGYQKGKNETLPQTNT